VIEAQNSQDDLHSARDQPYSALNYWHMKQRVRPEMKLLAFLLAALLFLCLPALFAFAGA
jgi:hypothetical protein